jgi:hypothetical protein
VNDLTTALEECVSASLQSAASREECLQRHGDHAAELLQLLDTAAMVQRGQALQPSKHFRAEARAELLRHMHVRPRRRPAFVPWGFLSAPFRLAWTFAGVALLLVIAGTSLAQAALPNGALYGWKLTSERGWRGIYPDPLYVDLAIADRRVDEWRRSAGNVEAERLALDGYVVALANLSQYDDPGSQARIEQRLAIHQNLLAAAGISLPELDRFGQATPQPLPSQTPSLVPPSATASKPTATSAPATPTAVPTETSVAPAVSLSAVPPSGVGATALPIVTALPATQELLPTQPPIPAALPTEFPTIPTVSVDPPDLSDSVEDFVDVPDVLPGDDDNSLELPPIHP